MPLWTRVKLHRTWLPGRDTPAENRPCNTVTKSIRMLVAFGFCITRMPSVYTNASLEYSSSFNEHHPSLFRALHVEVKYTCQASVWFSIKTRRKGRNTECVNQSELFLPIPLWEKKDNVDTPCLPARLTICFSPAFLSSRFFIHLCQYIFPTFFFSLPFESATPSATTRDQKKVHRISVDP